MIRKVICFVFSTFLNLNIKKIDNNNRILLSLRLQSLREVGDKSVEKKITLAMTMLVQVQVMSRRSLTSITGKPSIGRVTCIAILAMLISIWVISKKP